MSSANEFPGLLVTMGLSLWYGIQLYLTLKPAPGGFVLVKIFYIDGAFYFFFVAGMLASTSMN